MSEIHEREMSREERLSRALFKLYGFTVVDKNEAVKRMRKNGVPESDIKSFCNSSFKFAAKPAGPGVWWSDECVFKFDEWSQVLFGSLKHDLLNDFIEYHAEFWKPLCRRLSKLLKYDNIEELDIQLTLLGYRKSTNGIKEFASLY